MKQVYLKKVVTISDVSHSINLLSSLKCTETWNYGMGRNKTEHIGKQFHPKVWSSTTRPTSNQVCHPWLSASRFASNQVIHSIVWQNLWDGPLDWMWDRMLVFTFPLLKQLLKKEQDGTGAGIDTWIDRALGKVSTAISCTSLDKLYFAKWIVKKNNLVWWRMKV